MNVYLGIDLGGTRFRLAVREAGRDLPLLDAESFPAEPSWTGEDLHVQMARALESIVRRTTMAGPAFGGEMRALRSFAEWNVLGVGVGLTGDIDCRDGVCYSMKRFPGLEGFPLRSFLAEKWGRPVHILNDGLTAALAERRAGAGKDARDFVMVTLGTGIGGGIVVGGRVLAGERGRVGKVGHQIVDIDGPVHCHCGLPGCWQTFGGKEGVIARVEAVDRECPEAGLARRATVNGSIDLQRVIELASEGDPAAGRVMRETGRYVGVGLANLVKILAPERLLVGGGLAEGNRVLFEAVERTVREYAIKPYQDIPVVPAELGKDAGMIGATFLAEGWPQGDT